MPSPFPSKAVANFFLKRGQPTQMQLHKLIYYGHGWYLGHVGEPLLDEAVQAWQYGPVLPSIYDEFRMFGANPITRLARQYNAITGTLTFVPPVNESDGFAYDLLERVWEVYGKFTAARLIELTHAADSPWTKARKRNPEGVRVVIRNDWIRSHFKSRLDHIRNAS